LLTRLLQGCGFVIYGLIGSVQLFILKCGYWLVIMWWWMLPAKYPGDITMVDTGPEWAFRKWPGRVKHQFRAVVVRVYLIK